MSTASPRSTVEAEIAQLEERLRLAEWGPDPRFFEKALDDKVVLVSEDCQPFFAKRKCWALTNQERGPSSRTLR